MYKLLGDVDAAGLETHSEDGVYYLALLYVSQVPATKLLRTETTDKFSSSD